jgi:hypothetical protein
MDGMSWCVCCGLQILGSIRANCFHVRLQADCCCAGRLSNVRGQRLNGVARIRNGAAETLNLSVAAAEKFVVDRVVIKSSALMV